ncbi:MAG TPA: DUF4339 domain-containing protein [Rhizomicrobium sp.]|jgi:hypothetical protein|nr:DUF4339 domain-containing protein [Rhizomicrobium sp.]
MTGSWIISAGGRTYGPFGIEQLRAFAGEGRLARQSLVARAGETEFHKAGDEPELADIFAPPASDHDADVVRSLRREPSAGFGRNDEGARSEGPCHFVIIADMKSGSIARLEETIATLGHSVAILPQTWLLSSRETVNAIRNVLTPQLGKLDMLFVVDAGNDKAAWFNFGPEADARIRKLWRSEPKLRAAS